MMICDCLDYYLENNANFAIVQILVRNLGLLNVFVVASFGAQRSDQVLFYLCRLEV